MKAIFIKAYDGSLRPGSDEAVKILTRYRSGDEILLEHKRNRSAANHRRFFSFVQMTFEWQDTYDDIEIWRKVLEMGAGHFTTVIGLDGKTYYWPKSIAWDEMDEDAFSDLFSRVVQGYLRRYGSELIELQFDLVNGF